MNQFLSSQDQVLFSNNIYQESDTSFTMDTAAIQYMINRFQSDILRIWSNDSLIVNKDIQFNFVYRVDTAGAIMCGPGDSGVINIYAPVLLLKYRVYRYLFNNSRHDRLFTDIEHDLRRSYLLLNYSDSVSSVKINTFYKEYPEYNIFNSFIMSSKKPTNVFSLYGLIDAFMGSIKPVLSERELKKLKKKSLKYRKKELVLFQELSGCL